MRPWDEVEERPAPSDEELEFARVWRATPKVVFSTTLEEVEEDATLVKQDAVAAVERLKAEPGKPLAVGAPGSRRRW